MTHSKTNLTRVIQALLGTALLFALFWAVAAFGGGTATVQASATGADSDGMVLTGPTTASIGQAVTYTTAFTVPQSGTTFYLTYRFPTGFNVTGYSNGASVVNNTVYWAQGVLGSKSTVTVTGSYQVGSCPTSVHDAALGDIYDPGSALPSASTTTTVSDVHCVQLPILSKPSP